MSDSDISEKIKETQEWKERNRIKNMFLKACSIGDIDYVISNFDEQHIHKRKGLTLACRYRKINVIKFLIKKGAFGCQNCGLHNFDPLSTWALFCKKQKDKLEKENPEMSFGNIASLLKTKWKEIKKNKIELEKYEKEIILINQKHLRCLTRIKRF